MNCMKRILLLIFTCLALTIQAQEEPSNPQEAATIAVVPQTFIGYLSYDSVLAAMPQRAIVEKQLGELTAQYEAELKRVEDEFNQKYEAFLDGRKDFPRTILLKRQTELQQLMQRNVEFREKSRHELQEARDEAYAPLRQQLSEAIATVAQRNKLAVVINTDANACPFIDPTLAIDISLEVKNVLHTSSGKH